MWKWEDGIEGAGWSVGWGIQSDKQGGGFGQQQPHACAEWLCICMELHVNEAWNCA